MTNHQNLDSYGDDADETNFDLDAEDVGGGARDDLSSSAAGKILLAALAGAAAGAVVGLLFAPDKGSNTVASLRDSAGRYGSQLEGALKKYLDKLEAFGLSRAKKARNSVKPASSDDVP